MNKLEAIRKFGFNVWTPKPDASNVQGDMAPNIEADLLVKTFAAIPGVTCVPHYNVCHPTTVLIHISGRPIPVILDRLYYHFVTRGFHLTDIIGHNLIRRKHPYTHETVALIADAYVRARDRYDRLYGNTWLSCQSKTESEVKDISDAMITHAADLILEDVTGPCTVASVAAAITKVFP